MCAQRLQEPSLQASGKSGVLEGIPNDVTITCTDGTKLNKRVDFPRGHTRNPMTDEEVVAKFHRMAQGVVTDKTAATILDLAWKLDTLTDITPLFGFEAICPRTEPRPQGSG
jgi:2-methylcitrate dehydratase